MQGRQVCCLKTKALGTTTKKVNKCRSIYPALGTLPRELQSNEEDDIFGDSVGEKPPLTSVFTSVFLRRFAFTPIPA